MKKIISIALAAIMLVAASVNVSASYTGTGSPEHNVVIGTIYDEDGVLLSDIGTLGAPFARATAATGLPFSMTASGVTTLLTTRNSTGKNFTGGAMDGVTGEGLKITGTVTATNGTGSSYKVRVGACYLDTDNATYISVMPKEFTSGTACTAWIPKWAGMGVGLYFQNTQTYYGHITHIYSSGSVSGTLDFSVSAEPSSHI